MSKKKNISQKIEWLIKDKYDNKPDLRLKNDVKRLKEGEPVDYVIGSVPFLGVNIDLSYQPLIPRPETEWWVEQAMLEIKNQKARSKNKEVKILDLFAGSGCIGLALLRHISNSRADFGEKDKNLLKQIKLNCELNKIDKKRCRVLETDIFSSVKGRYDYIFANPPYIASARKETVRKEVLKWEPALALWGGREGTEIIESFLKEAPDHLKPEGKIYLEFGQGQMKKIKEFAKKLGYSNCTVRKDQFGRFRLAVFSL